MAGPLVDFSQPSFWGMFLLPILRSAAVAPARARLCALVYRPEAEGDDSGWAIGVS
jgi:hypothetical protein